MSERRRHSESERMIHRLRNTMPDKLETLCKMHLSFLLDLDGTKLEDLFGSPEARHDHKKRIATPLRKKKDKATLFGSPLSADNISQIHQLIEYLGRPENIKTEGLFRKTGNVSRQRLLKEWLNQGADLCLEDQTFSPHDCATVLKSYLAELPEPLLTERHYIAHCQISNMVKSAESDKAKLRARDKQIKTLQLLFLLLPRENCLLLDSIFQLLHKVTKVSENKMTAHNLGTVFAPSLLCPRKLSALELHSVSSTVSQAVAFMIANAPQMFMIPRELAIDVGNFWREMENPDAVFDLKDDVENSDPKLYKATKWTSACAVNTAVTFAERRAASDTSASSDTQVGLAELYAHVQAMPESTKKKKFMKQFNRASGIESDKSKHARSRTLGESIRKRLPSLHKHKRRGSQDNSIFTCNLQWAVTPVNIDTDKADSPEKDLDSTTSTTDTPVKILSFECSPTPNRKHFHKKVPTSPAVHIVDMKVSNPRKRASSGDSDESTPEKRSASSLQTLVTREQEINYMYNRTQKMIPIRTQSLCTKPIAMVSPITHSLSKAPISVKKAICTPRSRQAMTIISSPYSYESAM